MSESLGIDHLSKDVRRIIYEHVTDVRLQPILSGMYFVEHVTPTALLQTSKRINDEVKECVDLDARTKDPITIICTAESERFTSAAVHMLRLGRDYERMNKKKTQEANTNYDDFDKWTLSAPVRSFEGSVRRLNQALGSGPSNAVAEIDDAGLRAFHRIGLRKMRRGRPIIIRYLIEGTLNECNLNDWVRSSRDNMKFDGVQLSLVFVSQAATAGQLALTDIPVVLPTKEEQELITARAVALRQDLRIRHGHSADFN